MALDSSNTRMKAHTHARTSLDIITVCVTCKIPEQITEVSITMHWAADVLGGTGGLGVRGQLWSLSKFAQSSQPHEEEEEEEVQGAGVVVLA